MFASLGLNTITKSLNSQPILNVTINDFLWGYEDPLLSLASKFVPSINFEKFGILDRMFDDGFDFVEINLPNSVTKKEYTESLETNLTNDTETTTANTEYDTGFFGFKVQRIQKIPEVYKPPIRDYSINQWNGSPGLRHWGYTNKRLDSDKIYYLQCYLH